ncbi:hypothetical protein [Microbulbifer taiwanensis]|uniref:Uncharacterized protein n=1 Tax=Microbulbifer taiwanensis TaxID=986746 RepID=A0ABW1YNW2_9GAMM|nr:hypothetical protein [Microbulbifer taiwanensis]
MADKSNFSTASAILLLTALTGSFNILADADNLGRLENQYMRSPSSNLENVMPANPRGQSSLHLSQASGSATQAAEQEMLSALKRSGDTLDIVSKQLHSREASPKVLEQIRKLRRLQDRLARDFAQQVSRNSSASRSQDVAQKYTQYVQLSTQLMSELQNTERDLAVDLQSMRSDLDNHWQAYSSTRD